MTYRRIKCNIITCTSKNYPSWWRGPVIQTSNSLIGTVSRIQNRHRLSNLTSLHVIKISEEYKVTRYGDFYAWFQCSKITQKIIFIVIQLKTISDISVPVYIIQWWHLQDDPNRVHPVIRCVWSSTEFFYVVELCTNNEKVRRHLQICIVESTCVCTGNKPQHCEINHCVWWVLRLQIQIQLDSTRWTRERMLVLFFTITVAKKNLVWGSISLSCLGEGNGNPLQCSCLESPRDGGASWAAVCGVAQSWTRLRRLSSSMSIWL